MTRFEPERLRETYLLLVEAHVYSGNHSAVGSKEQELWCSAARDLIRECMRVRELRHTRPDPPEDYPTEMLQFFEDVRREVFGSFEIQKLQPAEAEVIFDGEVLEAGEDGIRRAVDVPVGSRSWSSGLGGTSR